MKKIFILSLLFLSSHVWAIMVNDGTNMCGIHAYDKMYATYQPNSYTCSSGQFLPANAIACALCPTDYSCSGGTFDFNAKYNQGLGSQSTFTHNLTNTCATNAPHGFIATYQINSYNCSSGNYLPANGIACAPCPAGGNCSGGTFTFNETTNQGVDSCNTGYYKDNGTCIGNTITVRWDDGNGGAYSTTCSYGGALTTPTSEPVAPRGYHFTGWSFNLSN